MATPYSEPLFDLLSYARRGPGRRDRVASAEVPQIARTAARTPEVMVKVLSRGANDLAAVRKHLDYIGRKGKVDLETDDGDKLRSAKYVLDDWDLELDEYRAGSELSSTDGKQAPRLVHKVLFSMPAGTPPAKVLAAVQNFCREEFALKHRYAMALHTDEPHPHVHAVIKAVSEHGVRLHIKKATLRRWRQEFAWHLRAQGIEANATPRVLRGQTRGHKLDGIYRAHKRGASTHMRRRAEEVAAELLRGVRVNPGKAKLVQTRKEVERGWVAVGEVLERQGQPELAANVRRFLREMSHPETEKELIARALLERARAPRVDVRPPSR